MKQSASHSCNASSMHQVLPSYIPVLLAVVLLRLFSVVFL